MLTHITFFFSVQILGPDLMVFFSSFFFFLCSATSVDVEEHLYRLATGMGITVVTSSQVSLKNLQW